MEFVRPSELALHGNVAENWRRFKQRLMLYLEATEKATKPDKLKVAILLNFIGEEALEVFNTFHLKEDEAENFDLVINKFDDFCEPKKNVIFERFKFFSATQKDGESIDSFITELKGLSSSCEFESQKDSLIRDRIVYGIQDKALQERLLREPNLTLLKAIEMCKTNEISKQQIKIMQNNQNICQIRKYEKKHSPKQNQESEKEFKCQRCGKSHRAKNCPAWGKRCSKCKKMNHFAAFCKSSAIRSLNDETKETVWSIHEAKVVHTLEWKKSIIVNGKEICFKLDSGAEVNVLPYTFTRQMKGLEIFQTNRKLTSYTGHEIKIKGIATLNCKTKNKTESLEFFIADGYYQPILGIEAIEKLSLIKKCDAVQTEQNNSAKEILNRHKNIFEGIGRLPIEHKIRINENTTPVIAPSRKIPFSIREKVKAELERMEKLDIIEKVEEPSEWTHPIVVVQKPSGDVRICMDPRELNKYVQRERYILPTAETIFSELKGATVFSVFDASSAFWQVPLDKESTNLCTIATPFGRFRFKRLPYGLNSASEVFQRCINNILSGLQGTACYMDDILIYGNTMEEHNRNLETVLRRLEENNVKLNAKKQQIAVDKVNFLGHIISRDGIAIQASRAEAIQKLKRPENKTEVQRFLGMVTYLGKFIPNLSDKTAPLRKLISNKSEWKFGGEENDCFENLKDMVSNAPILTFFDPTKPITISSDASQYGIGTVLMQGGQAIEYASFSLNATQRKYAQIEKELLAIVFGCERFQYYIWGNDVIVETDHKPLLSIVKKPLEKLSPRLQRMVLRLMRFQISLKFTPGKNMFVADHLSRDPLKDEVDTSYLEGRTESVHMLLVTTDEKIKRLQKETHEDHTLIQLIEYAKNGWPKYKTMVCDEAKPYWQFQDEIHVSDGIVYKGNCIMVPSTLRKEILQVVHSSHQGIAASKEKARSAFYWPGMITQVENEVEKCRTCQEYSRKNPEESRIAHEIPEFPWEKIAVDFMEVSGTSSILVVDYHSKFVEIRKLSSKRETETIMQLKTIFRTHGIPRTLVSDNGPPFNSTGFKNFAQKYEFKHQTSSPKYPRSNGQVERTIQTIKGLIIKAVKSGRDPNLALMEFNNTPKYDLPSPTQMLMGRSVRTLSTYTRQQLKPLFDTTKNYQKLRDHQQKYAGSPKRILRPLEVGDNIMLQERHRKWVPATVTAKHETPRSYMVKTPSGSEYRRNRSHLRPRKFSVEDSAPTSQSPSIPGSQAGTAMDDNIQDHGRPTSENRRAYDPREDIAKKGEESSTSPSVRTRSGRTISTSIVNYSPKQDSNKDEKENKDYEESKFSQVFKALLGLVGVYGVITLISLMFPNSNHGDSYRYVSWIEFFHGMLSRGEVKELVVKPELNLVIIHLQDGAYIKGKRADHLTYHMNIAGVGQFEEKLRVAERSLGIGPENQIPVVYERAQDNMWIILIALVAVAASILYMFRSGHIKTPSPMDIAKPFTRARFTLVDPHNPRSKIFFKDVAGLKEPKAEIMEFVDYLKKPEKYQSFGAKIPKGVLLLGPPGCGKTMLAKAVATEAGVPFLAMAGSDFVEMIGGLGAARVRDLFSEARKRAPSIIYIDEIDTIGRNRSMGEVGESREEEQTLNQLLVEMDGMASTEGVIMLASTNRAEVLDKALLRRGRFDKHILIDLPTLIERDEIFARHLRSITLENPPTFYSKRLAQLTPGFSGADIANVCNEAALHAARSLKKKVDKDDLEYAVERVVGGTEKRTQVMTPEEKKVVAFHECGHALVSWMLKHTDILMKVSIVPRTIQALGFAQYLPSDQKLYSKEQLFERMCAALGGRAAEAVIFNKITTGGVDDLEKVTNMAYAQVEKFGMDETIGNLSFPSREPFQSLPYSKETASTMDFHASRMVGQAYKHSEQLLREHRDKLIILAEALLKKETLNYSDIEALIGPPPHGPRQCVDIPDWGTTPTMDPSSTPKKQPQPPNSS
ncbi:K02A2.6-like [Cordylochernes scorpioides]|uniref:RNA-directed DNA polymerase n=1 Tax=Cordylochernes scorpioides TaxID=51811 RepID=A0ABY6K0Z4_9ARAC|nr:K02A2.6-like [Cordylochernes scorpioides]